MATRGVIQCQKLTLFYCEHGGSSQAVREYLQSGRLLQWARDRPQVAIQVKVRNGKHPYVRAEYLTGIEPKLKNNFDNNDELRTKPNAHQICLKSNQARSPDVEGVFDQLYNRSGRKITKLTKPVYTQTPSIQGVWTPSLNLHLTPEFPMEIKE